MVMKISMFVTFVNAFHIKNLYTLTVWSQCRMYMSLVLGMTAVVLTDSITLVDINPLLVLDIDIEMDLCDAGGDMHSLFVKEGVPIVTSNF